MMTTPRKLATASRNSLRRWWNSRANAPRSAMEMAAARTTAASTDWGSADSRPGRHGQQQHDGQRPHDPVTWVRVPAVSATAVRDALDEIG